MGTFKDFIDIDNLMNYGIYVSFTEAIIEPAKVKLKNTDIEYLTKKYPEITFSHSNDLKGHYDANKDVIHIEYNAKKTSVDELQTMIGDKATHSVQYKIIVKAILDAYNVLEDKYTLDDILDDVLKIDVRGIKT